MKSFYSSFSFLALFFVWMVAGIAAFSSSSLSTPIKHGMQTVNRNDRNNNYSLHRFNTVRRPPLLSSISPSSSSSSSTRSSRTQPCFMKTKWQQQQQQQQQTEEVKKSNSGSFQTASGYNNNNNNKKALLAQQRKDKDSPFFKKFLEMPRLEDDLSVTEAIQEEHAPSSSVPVAALALGVVVLTIAALSAVLSSIGVSLPTSVSEVMADSQYILNNPTDFMEQVVQTVHSAGSVGPVVFGIVYTLAEILAIPAIPLTASAGYLFGVTEGTAVVLASASVAAAASFIIGRTLLRTWVEETLEGNREFERLDKAIGKDGFKLMLLLRLSPIFPFALSNYLYGATSIQFWPFFWGTMLGFAPGTMAYVYAGVVGKALTIDVNTAEPWYVYAGGFALLSGFLKLAADVATGIIEEMEDEAEAEAAEKQLK